MDLQDVGTGIFGKTATLHSFVGNEDEAKLVLNLNYHCLLPISIQDTICFISDVLTMSLLYGKNLKMLPKIKIVLPLLSDATQVKYNAGGVAMQDSAAQH